MGFLGAAAAHEQISAALQAIDAAHDILRATSSDLLANNDRIQIAERLETQDRINRGLMYRFFAEIADPPDGAESIPAVRDQLWARLRITPQEIRRRFKLAARIRPRRSLSGPPLPPQLPELAAAVQAGSIGEDHLRAICRALDVLPAAVSPAEVADAERTLVDHAAKLDAAVITRLGERIADYLNPDGHFSDTDRARRRGLHLGPQGPDGMSRLQGLLDPEARAYFEALTAAVRPGRHQPDTAQDTNSRQDTHTDTDTDTDSGQDTDPDTAQATDTDTGGGPDTDTGGAPTDPDTRDQRTPAQRRHDALKLGMATAIASGDLGTHRGHPVTVIVTTTLAELDQAAKASADPSVPMPAPARTGGGSRMPMSDLIRLAATAIHYLAVFDDHTERPLYLGRQKRVATADQRIICHARDRGCTRPTCLEPGYHCEVHHATEWADGGQTDADNLFFACGPDHSAATRGDQHTQPTDSGRLGWTDGTNPPQINHAHHPDELLRGDPDPPREDDH